MHRLLLLCPLLLLAGCRPLPVELTEAPLPAPTPVRFYESEAISKPNPPFSPQAFIAEGRLPKGAVSAPAKPLPAGFVPPAQRVTGQAFTAQAAPVQSVVQTTNLMLNNARTVADCEKIRDLINDAAAKTRAYQTNPTNDRQLARQAPYLSRVFQVLGVAVTYKTNIVQSKNVADSQAKLTAALRQAYAIARTGDSLR